MTDVIGSSQSDPLFVLQSISYCGGSRYLVCMTRGEDEITSEVEVKIVGSPGSRGIEVVEFVSEEFNRLCTLGNIYGKPLGPAILAFHRCIHL